MQLREATKQDFDQIWPFLSEIVAQGETYAFDQNMTQAEAQAIWMDLPHKTYVVEEEGNILGSYYLKPNFAGPGAHVANCGYMVSSAARGKGIARKMCEHSQKMALELGYKSMQFNCVVSVNEVGLICGKNWVLK